MAWTALGLSVFVESIFTMSIWVSTYPIFYYGGVSVESLIDNRSLFTVIFLSVPFSFFTSTDELLEGCKLRLDSLFLDEEEEADALDEFIFDDELWLELLMESISSSWFLNFLLIGGGPNFLLAPTAVEEKLYLLNFWAKVPDLKNYDWFNLGGFLCTVFPPFKLND